MSKTQYQSPDSAYLYCQKIASEHYENFPTASVFLNQNQRRATAAIYAFARQADDIADEGDMDDATRRRRLGEYKACLEAIYTNTPVDDPVFIALSDSIRRYSIPQQPFSDLLTAFNMDVDKNRYADFSSLLGYCRHSANPIGELVLRLHGFYTKQNKLYSDQICTALQLINFIQDIEEDIQQRNRIYIPQDEMRDFHVEPDDLSRQHDSGELHALLRHQIERARNGLLAGSPLCNGIKGKLKLIINLTICAGLVMCDKLQARENSYLRPTLSKWDWVKIGLRALSFRADEAHAKILHSDKQD